MKGGVFIVLSVFLLYYNTVFSSTGELTESGEVLTLTGEVLQEDIGVIQEQNEILFDAIVTFQQPSYIIQDSQDIQLYICDASKPECKVNFSLLESFSQVGEKNYGCHIDFGFVTGEEEKCNPATVIFPYGEHNVIFSVYEKQTQILVSSKIIHISHKIPEIIDISPQIDVQSGVSLQDEKYICNNSTSCTLNFQVVDAEIPLKDSQFLCTWDFPGATFDMRDTLSKCNPGYVHYGYGDFQVSVHIQEKAFPNREWKKEIFFSNPPSQTTIQEPRTGTGDIFPSHIILTLQKPSDISLFDAEKKSYLCNQQKTECRVNFSLEDTFGGYVPKKYACRIETGFTTGEEEKCNPKTIIFPSGKHRVKFEIYERETPQNHISYEIQIENAQNFGEDIVQTQQENIVKQPNLIIQSGGYFQDGKIICSEEECKLNFKIESATKKSCKWHFIDVKTSQKSLESCNPSLVEFLQIDSPFSLEIFNSEGTLEKIENFTVYNLPRFQKYQYNHAPVGIISLQGKNKNIQKSGNTVFCFSQDVCSINFTASGSFDQDNDNISYSWDFGNGQNSDKKNPAKIDFGLGNYTLRLKVSDALATSVVERKIQILLPGEIPLVLQDKNIFTQLQISALQVNPKGKDTQEWIEIENTGIHILNLHGVQLRLNGEKTYTLSGILLPKAKKKLYKSQTKFVLKNTQGKVELVYDTQSIDSLERNFPVKDGMILTRGMLSVRAQKVKVVEVIDGDTIVIELENGTKEKLRFIGVDTPETKHPKKIVEFFGIQAYEYTKSQLLGQELYLEIDSENYRDKYGRLLGYIRFPEAEKTFNQILIEQGYARAYVFFPFAYMQEFQDAQKLAKKQKLGMWGDPQMKKELLLMQEQELELGDISNLQIGEFDMINFLQTTLLFVEPGDLKSAFHELFTSIDTQTNRWYQSVPTEKSAKKITKAKKVPFTLQVTRLKSGLKVGGKTLPNAHISILLGNYAIQVSSDTSGKYTFVFTDQMLSAGELALSVKILSAQDELLAEKQKTVEVSTEYISQIHQYLQKKLVAKLKKLQKAKKVITPKPKKISITQALPKVFTSPNVATNIYLHFLVLCICFAVFGFFSIYGYKYSQEKY